MQGPSKNKIEKKWKQAQEELAVRKLASEQAEEADKLLKVQVRREAGGGRREEGLGEGKGRGQRWTSCSRSR